MATFTELKVLEDLLRCPICYEFMETAMVVPKCSHTYCSLCIRRYICYKTQCPTCNAPVAEPDLINNRLVDEIIAQYKSLSSGLLAGFGQDPKSNKTTGKHTQDGASYIPPRGCIKNNLPVVKADTGVSSHRQTASNDCSRANVASGENGLPRDSPIRASGRSRRPQKRKPLHYKDVGESGSEDDPDFIEYDSSDDDFKLDKQSNKPVLHHDNSDTCESDYFCKVDLSTSTQSKQKNKFLYGDSPPRAMKSNNCKEFDKNELARQQSQRKSFLYGDNVAGLSDKSNSSLNSAIGVPTPTRMLSASQSIVATSPPIDSVYDIDVATPSIGQPESRVLPEPSIITSPPGQVIRVACPVCGTMVPERSLNLHLDSCLLSGPRKSALRSSVPRRKNMPKLVYNLLSDKELRKKCMEVGLPTQGARKALIKRHQEFTLLYNSQCDSLHPKSGPEIIREMQRSEEIRSDRSATFSTATTNPGIKLERGASVEQVEAAQKHYVNSHKNQFKSLIAETKRRMMEEKLKSVTEREAGLPLPSLDDQMLRQTGGIDSELTVGCVENTDTSTRVPTRTNKERITEGQDSASEETPGSGGNDRTCDSSGTCGLNAEEIVAPVAKDTSSPPHLVSACPREDMQKLKGEEIFRAEDQINPKDHTTRVSEVPSTSSAQAVTSSEQAVTVAEDASNGNGQETATTDDTQQSEAEEIKKVDERISQLVHSNSFGMEIIMFGIQEKLQKSMDRKYKSKCKTDNPPANIEIKKPVTLAAKLEEERELRAKIERAERVANALHLASTLPSTDPTCPTMFEDINKAIKAVKAKRPKAGKVSSQAKAASSRNVSRQAKKVDTHEQKVLVEKTNLSSASSRVEDRTKSLRDHVQDEVLPTPSPEGLFVDAGGMEAKAVALSGKSDSFASQEAQSTASKAASLPPSSSPTFELPSLGKAGTSLGCASDGERIGAAGNSDDEDYVPEQHSPVFEVPVRKSSRRSKSRTRYIASPEDAPENKPSKRRRKDRNSEGEQPKRKKAKKVEENVQPMEEAGQIKKQGAAKKKKGKKETDASDVILKPKQARARKSKD